MVNARLYGAAASREGNRGGTVGMIQRGRPAAALAASPTGAA